MSLRSALNALNDAVEDLTSLHVKTYTGTVNLTNDPGATAAQRFESIEQATTVDDASVVLAMETLIRFDGDTLNLIGDGASNAVRDAHAQAVEAGLEARRGLLELVTDWID